MILYFASNDDSLFSLEGEPNLQHCALTSYLFILFLYDMTHLLPHFQVIALLASGLLFTSGKCK